jgi:TonB family protein
MLLEALAAASVAAAQDGAGQAPPAPNVTVYAPERLGAPPSAKVVVPVDDTAMGIWASVWPMDAYKARISGHVILSCDIDRFGLAEWCKVASETPQGQGFGAAALELRPTFKLTPATGPDGPIDSVMSIAVDFRAPAPRLDFGRLRDGGPTVGGDIADAAKRQTSDITMFGEPFERRQITMLNAPVWVSTATFDDWVRAYPARAAGVEGYAVAHCEVQKNGNLSGCQLIKEAPENKGFGKAALMLAARFKVSPQWAQAPGHADLWVDVPIRFSAPGASGSRVVTSPYWLSGFDPDQSLRLFPPEAAAKGLTTGLGVAKCIVAEDGSLTDCGPDMASSDAPEFADVAVKLASTMRMNPWSSDGAPVDGAVIRLGVRLNLKSEDGPPASAD